MHTINEYVEDALRDSGIVAKLLDPVETSKIRNLIDAKYCQMDGYRLWERLGPKVSVKQDGAWTWISSFIRHQSCLLFFDIHESRRVYKFESGYDIVSMLHSAYGFEFYVTDHDVNYLLAFNHHDFLIACGAATGWLERESASRS